MKYILLNDNVVSEIIPGEDPIFPGVPIEDRYAPQFIARLLSVADEIEVEQNWVYNPENGAFLAPVTEVSNEPETEPIIKE